MGFCIYQRNPSELYRETQPGTAPEPMCGARTFPAVDEPEVAVVRVGMGSDGAIYEYRPTGNMQPRAQHDPYCPRHGGSPEPAPPPVSQDELQAAWAAYQLMLQRFEGQGGTVPGLTPPSPAQLTAAAAPVDDPAALVTAGDVGAAAAAYTGLAARAAAEQAPALAPAGQ